MAKKQKTCIGSGKPTVDSRCSVCNKKVLTRYDRARLHKTPAKRED